MIGALVVLMAWFTAAALPVTGYDRMDAMLGRRQRPTATSWVSARRAARRAHRLGQAETTLLLQRLIAELDAGMTSALAFAQALGGEWSADRLETSPPTADTHIWRDVASVWRGSDTAGYSLAQAVRRIHGYALTDQEVAREVHANIAAPGLAIKTLAALPVAAWMLGSMSGGDVVGFLLRNPVGWACMVVGSALLAAAWWWMRALTAAALR